MTPTHHGHAPDSPRIPPWQIIDVQPERSEEAYREHITELMRRWESNNQKEPKCTSKSAPCPDRS